MSGVGPWLVVTFSMPVRPGTRIMPPAHTIASVHALLRSGQPAGDNPVVCRQGCTRQASTPTWAGAMRRVAACHASPGAMPLAAHPPASHAGHVSTRRLSLCSQTARRASHAHAEPVSSLLMTRRLPPGTRQASPPAHSSALVPGQGAATPSDAWQLVRDMGQHRRRTSSSPSSASSSSGRLGAAGSVVASEPCLELVAGRGGVVCAPDACARCLHSPCDHELAHV